MNIEKIKLKTVVEDETEIIFSNLKLGKEKESTYSVLLGNNGNGKTACLEAVLNVFTNRFRTGLISSSSVVIDGREYTDENNKSEIKKSKVKKVIVSTYSPFDRILQTERSLISKGELEDCVEIVYPQHDSQIVHSLCSSAYLKSQLYPSKKKVIDELSDFIGLDSNLLSLDIREITQIQGAGIVNKIDGLSIFEKKEMKKLIKQRTNLHKTEILKNDNRKNVLEVIESIRRSSRSSEYKEDVLCQFSILIEIKDHLKYFKKKYGKIINKRLLIDVDYLLRSYSEKYGQNFKKILSYDIDILQKLNIHLVNNLLLKKNNRKIFLNQLSSGEFALFSRLMEIEASIEENSIVLIDEPETHLNPKWIFEYMNLLKKMFNDKNSSFIIASQSPFIVGVSKKENVYSLNVDKEKGNIKNVEKTTLGANYDEILKDIFGIGIHDNKILTAYSDEIIHKSKKNMIKALNMTSDIAETSFKFNLLDNLLSEENTDVIEKQIQILRSDIDGGDQ